MPPETMGWWEKQNGHGRDRWNHNKMTELQQMLQHIIKINDELILASEGVIKLHPV